MEKNGFHADLDLGENAHRVATEQEIYNLIGPEIHKTVNQYHSLLRQGLEQEVKRIIQEFEHATLDIEDTITKRVRTRLTDMVQQEVRRIFDDALSNAEDSLKEPAWNKPGPSIEYESRKLLRGYEPPARRSHKNGDERGLRRDDDQGDWGGGVHAEAPRQPAAPSAFAKVRSQEEPKEQVGLPPASGQPLTDRSQPSQVVSPSAPRRAGPVSAFERPEPVGSAQGKSVGVNQVISQDQDVHVSVGAAVVVQQPSPAQGRTQRVEPAGVSQQASPAPASEPIEWPEPFASAQESTTSAVESVPQWREQAECVEPFGGVYPEQSRMAQENPVSVAQAVSRSEDDPIDLAPAGASQEPVLASGRIERAEQPFGEVYPEKSQSAQGSAASVVQAATQPLEPEIVAPRSSPSPERIEQPEPFGSAQASPVEINQVISQNQDVHVSVAPAVVIQQPAPAEERSVMPATHQQGQAVERLEAGYAETCSELVEPIQDEEVYEGTVRLNVEANGCIRQVVRFVRELRQKPQVRLLRLVGNNREGVDIWLGLREPLRLRKMLPEIEGVSIMATSLMQPSAGRERLLYVRLAADPRSAENT